jgi:hypothetical protein
MVPASMALRSSQPNRTVTIGTSRDNRDHLCMLRCVPGHSRRIRDIKIAGGAAGRGIDVGSLRGAQAPIRTALKETATFLSPAPRKPATQRDRLGNSVGLRTPGPLWVLYRYALRLFRRAWWLLLPQNAPQRCRRSGHHNKAGGRPHVYLRADPRSC